MKHTRYAVRNENGFIRLEGKHFYDEVDFEKADLFLSKEKAENLSSCYNKAWVVEVNVEVEEMKKDKEWAFIELDKLFPKYTETHNYSDNIMDMKLELLNKVYDILTQLDEPEVLSQELPVIPKYVAEWIAKRRDDFDLYPALKILEGNSSIWGLTYKWYRINTHKFVNAYLTGDYEVEEEPLYYVMKDGVVILSKIDEYHQLDKSRWIGAVTNKEYIKENPDKVRFTEQEIKDFDERFWAFAVPVEEVGRAKWNKC